MSFKIGKDMTRPVLAGTITNKAKKAVDISGWTFIDSKLIHQGTLNEITLALANFSFTDTGTDGQWEYQWLANDTGIIGLYDFILKMNDATGNLAIEHAVQVLIFET